jgi:hypothetical protein
MHMNTKRILNQVRLYLLLVAGVIAFGASAVRAQDAPPSNDDPSYNGTYNPQMGDAQNGDNGNYDAPENGQDPPSRVARMSFLDGSVSFQPGGQGDWAQAERNRPVTIGDKIWVDNNSRAELQTGQASIHLSSMTALSFLNLDDQTTQMRLAEGAINFRVRELREGDVYEIDTPNLSFNVTQAGAFRIDVSENGDGTRITAIRGEGEVTANGQTYTIHSGERGEFNGLDDNVTYFVSAAPQPDDFDQWANDRDLRDDNSKSAQYVSRDVPGYSDLDDNGTWNEEPDYGPVWYPSTVEVGWAPYSYGYWNYVGPWGWTWVGHEPWGFAPFHYGRWAYIGSRWGWCPGPYYARPIYGPAFVGFLGGGFGFGGGIGWFPLGPREPFRPWYHTSGAYFRSVNFNNTRFHNSNFISRSGNFNYAYAHSARAVTVASRNNFVNGRAINRRDFHVSEASLRGAQVTNRAGFAPGRQSFVGAAGMRGNIARPSAAVESRTVMARMSPAAGASRLPVRTFGGNNSGRANNSGRGGFNGGNFGARGPVMGRTAQTGAAANPNRPSFSQGGQPQSHMRNSPADGGNNRSQANSGGTRNWSAQGNTTDRGRGPSGFGGNSGNANNANHPDRPAWAGSGAGSGTGSGSSRSGYSVNPRSSMPTGSSMPNRSNMPNNGSNYSNSNRGNSRSYDTPQRGSGYGSGYSGNRGSYNSNSNRGYSQQRSYSPPQQQRSYSPPSRSHSSPGPSGPSSQPRSYSPPRGYSGSSGPSRSYSAPSRSYSAPSRPSGGAAPRGGGSSHGGGGGGGSHGGGGSSSSHGGGSHGRR